MPAPLICLFAASLFMTPFQEPGSSEPEKKETRPIEDSVIPISLEEIMKKQLEEMLKEKLGGIQIRPPLRVGPLPQQIDFPSPIFPGTVIPTQDAESPQSPEIIQLDWTHLNPTGPDTEAPSEIRRFDLDGDGVDDLSLQRTDGRGPLSTYYGHYELIVLGETRILKGGAPLAIDTEITLIDLLSAGLSASLCSVGGSLRFPDESWEKFSGGAWWGQERQGLAIAMVRDGKLRLGYVLMSVSKRGDVEVHSTRLEEITLPSIRVAK
ncbi:MAG: hypothetical protein RL885_17550 [Planctomycetota bacterium]